MRWITKNGRRIPINEDDETSLEDALRGYYGKVKLPTIYLEKKEYAHVMGEINTWYDFKNKKKRIMHRAIGNYVYTFENRGYNEYRFIGRDEIESEFDDEWSESYE